ncbi:MAG: 30S ribosomal protein S11, partial [Acidobacteria bacterium]|nr:30S ribosomal protein S11 [Acidobacteriota bacterium]
NVLSWSSSGSLGFRGSRKGTPFAAQQASFTAATKAKDNAGLRTVDVKVSGPGAGRESAVRALGSVGIEVRSIRDTTPIPHNGCRPPKRRRV